MMQYPVVPREAITEHLPRLLGSAVPDLRFACEQRGTGQGLDVSALEARLAPIALSASRHDEGTSVGDRDQLEGSMSVLLFEAVQGLPLSVLDDPGFWAYLATGCLWPFVRLREPPESRNPDRYLLYIDGRSNTECVPLRMYLRARALARADSLSAAGAIPDAVDFWRSHVIRVKTGSHPGMVRAVVNEQVADRMNTDPVRQYAKRINRRWSNQVLYLLNDAECEDIARDERADLQEA
jgi:hypothetical protein